MITTTDRADQRFFDLLAESKSLGIRLGVKGAGCSGYMYTIEMVDSYNDDDTIFDHVAVDPETLKLLDGTEIDFVTEGLNQVFRFNNPNASASCGCGESFTIGD